MMKNLLLFLALVTLVTISAKTNIAQSIVDTAYRQECDRKGWSPIQCGYYGEGYQDGASDAGSDQNNDYKRYKKKYRGDYESFYREGYDQGYSSVKPYARWTNKQKNAYDRGYKYGDDDKDRGISRLPARYEGQYDRAYEAYYRRGYRNGYDQKPKTYDVPIGNRRNNRDVARRNVPRRNNRNVLNRNAAMTGSLDWSGTVDDRVNIILQGNTIRTQTVSGRSFGQPVRTISQTLPRRQAQVSVRKLDGRGTARVIQQPSRVNNYTSIIQIFDRKRGSDRYRLQFSWRASNALEAYSSGRVRWKGRVDQTVNIRIFGENVENVSVSGGPLRNASHDINGYLARRVGTVNVRRLDGRGTVRVLEQPSRQNNYVAVIQIFDPKRSDDEYEIEVTW